MNELLFALCMDGLLSGIHMNELLSAMLGGACSLFITALFYAAKLKRADKDNLNQIIAELVLLVDELAHNIAVVSELRQKAPEITDSCKSTGAVKQIFTSIRVDLIASSRVLLAKLGCEKATMDIVTKSLSEVSTLHEAVSQAKALIAMPHLEPTATLYAITRIQKLIDQNDQKTEPQAVIKRLELLKAEIGSHIVSYKAKLDCFDCDHSVFSYMWQI